MDAFKPLVLFVLLALPAAAFGQTAFVLAAEDNWYPYSAKVGSTLQGFAPELITAAFSAAGASVSYEVVPFARAMDGVKRGLYAGCFDAGDYEDLRADYLIPRQALEESVQVVWGGVWSTAVTSYRDLEGKTVGIANGYTYGPDLTANERIRKEVANEEIANLRKLALGRIDYTIIDRWVARYLLLNNEAALAGKVQEAGVLRTDRILPVFSKTHPDGAKALEIYDRGMTLIKKDGTYDKILKSWKTKLKIPTN